MVPMIDDPGGMCGSAALVRWKNALRLTARVLSHSSSVMSSSLSVGVLLGCVADEDVDPPELGHGGVNDG